MVCVCICACASRAKGYDTQMLFPAAASEVGGPASRLELTAGHVAPASPISEDYGKLISPISDILKCRSSSLYKNLRS